MTTTVSQQLAPRVSVELSYARRVWGNFQVTDNRAVGPADFDPFTIVAPADQRLPNGGGYSLQFYDIKPAKFGQFDNFITFADNYGKQIYHFNGIDLNVNARFPFALTLQGGFSTGNMTEDDCEVGESVPEIYIPPAAAARFRPCNRLPNGPGPIAIVSQGISRTSRDWRRTHPKGRRADQRDVSE